MALTKELLSADANLAGLTDEQLNAIVTMSANDENNVIATKTGEIYGRLDADLLAASGIAKNGTTEKTYDYAKRVIADFKGKADSASGLENQIATLTKEKNRLQKVIDEGGSDTEVNKQLKQARADLTSITNQFNELNKKYETSQADHTKELFGVRMDSMLQNATANITFKKDLPESVTKVLKDQVFAKIKSMNPEYIDDGKGGQVLAFKDANGAILRNPQNLLNPYTVEELINKEFNDMGIIEKANPGGTGTKPLQKPGGGGNISVSVAGAKTQNEAYEMIVKSLMDNGFVNGSDKFQSEFNKIWEDNNVSALPR